MQQATHRAVFTTLLVALLLLASTSALFSPNADMSTRFDECLKGCDNAQGETVPEGRKLLGPVNRKLSSDNYCYAACESTWLSDEHTWER
eukprot:jgi/Tetstr1/421010/TSEL_001093.t1